MNIDKYSSRNDPQNPYWNCLFNKFVLLLSWNQVSVLLNRSKLIHSAGLWLKPCYVICWGTVFNRNHWNWQRMTINSNCNLLLSLCILSIVQTQTPNKSGYYWCLPVQCRDNPDKENMRVNNTIINNYYFVQIHQAWLTFATADQWGWGTGKVVHVCLL